MMARCSIALALILSALVFVSGADAGGWASVRVVEGQPYPVAGQIWTASLVVKQHDRVEVDVDELTVRFAHAESGATIETQGTSTGEVGHYLIQVEFERSGVWDWTVTPTPFPETNMESLDVREPGQTGTQSTRSAAFVTGTCAMPGNEIERIALDDVQSESGGQLSTAIVPSLGNLGGSLDVAPTAVLIADSEADVLVLACADLPSAGLAEPAIIPIRPFDSSNYVGSVSLVPVNGDLVVTVTVFSLPASAGVTIRITDMNAGTYEPGDITVPAGTTVTWVNESTMAHTISGGGKGFRNSGMLDPGESFSQTFDVPGTYAYVCEPHPWMTGTITVTG